MEQTEHDCPHLEEARRKYKESKEAFISQWGALGSAWGINRTMAQIHALLLVSSRPLSTDDIMESLDISRGNAHMNLKTLIDWSLVSKVIVKGERKEYFDCEKDIWKMFCIITRVRIRREIEPAIDVLNHLSGRNQRPALS